MSAGAVNSFILTLVLLAAVAVMAALALLFVNSLGTEPKAAPLSGGCAGEPTIQALRTCLRQIRQQKAIREEAYAQQVLSLLAIQAASERGQARKQSKPWSRVSEREAIRLEGRWRESTPGIWPNTRRWSREALHQSQPPLTTEALEGSN